MQLQSPEIIFQQKTASILLEWVCISDTVFSKRPKKTSKFYLTETSVRRSRVGNLWSWKLNYQNWEINLEVQVVYHLFLKPLWFLILPLNKTSDTCRIWANLTIPNFRQILVLRPAKDNLLDLGVQKQRFYSLVVLFKQKIRSQWRKIYLYGPKLWLLNLVNWCC